MKVDQMMSRDVKTCRTTDTLVRPSQLMWEHDIGSVPVLDDKGALVGMITDRDICMAAYTQGRRLDEIAVGAVMSQNVQTCSPTDTLETAAASMKRHQLRRLPVVSARRELVGIISLPDLSRAAEAEPNQRTREQYINQVETTLAAVARPRVPGSAAPARA
jgi:CBS-domain-containing membrane protein